MSIEQTLNDIQVFNSWLQGFRVIDQESGATSYYGYMDRKMNYYIARSVSSGGVTAFRAFRGAGQSIAEYEADWNDRASKSYDYFPVLFT